MWSPLFSPTILLLVNVSPTLKLPSPLLPLSSNVLPLLPVQVELYDPVKLSPDSSVTDWLLSVSVNEALPAVLVSFS